MTPGPLASGEPQREAESLVLGLRRLATDLLAALGPDRVRVLGVAAALLVGLLVGRRLLRAARGGRGAGARPGEVWFALVPFEDGTGSKDRPVLVLDAGFRRCTVARFTSRDRDGHRAYVRVPEGVPGLPRASWAGRQPIELRRSALRRRIGTPGLALVLWYRDATGT